MSVLLSASRNRGPVADWTQSSLYNILLCGSAPDSVSNAAADCVAQLGWRVAATATMRHTNRIRDTDDGTARPDQVLADICSTGLQLLTCISTCMNFASFAIARGVLSGDLNTNIHALHNAMRSNPFVNYILDVLRSAPKNSAWIPARVQAIQLLEVVSMVFEYTAVLRLTVRTRSNYLFMTVASVDSSTK